MLNENNCSPFYSSFLSLCNKANLSPTAVAKKTGIASGAPTAWKNGAVPKPAQRKKLCEFFGVSDEELLGYKKDPIGVEPDGDDPLNKQLIDLLRQASPEQKKAWISLLKNMTHSK